MSEREQLEVFLWVLFALGLGGFIGLEREIRGHEAGIRTTAIVCAGAALFGKVSLSFDDTRIAAGVVQGIGFLCAGLVFQRDAGVRGVTTAASVWVMAAVGLAVASELWVVALLSTLTILVVLELAPLSDWILVTSRRHGLSHRGSPKAAEDSGAPVERKKR